MRVLETLIVAFSLFSALPMPRVDWNEKNMRYALCAFPLVGLGIGLAACLAFRLSALLHLPDVLRGALLCLIPVWITGGIHLDGYTDTCDALSSHRDVEKRQEILKDPHIGAFAAIRLCAYFVLSFALWAALKDPGPWALVGLYGLSRSLSGLALTLFPLRPGSGLARSFADAADKKRVRLGLGFLALLFALLLLASGQPAALLAAALAFLRYRRVSERDFGGASGDLAGWFLQTAELWMLAAMCLTQIGEALL